MAWTYSNERNNEVEWDGTLISKKFKGILESTKKLRWIKPYHSDIVATSQVAVAGRVFLLLFEVTEGVVNVDGIAISNAATIDGDIIVGIYGPVITEETATDLPLIVESAVTAHSGANTSQTITFTSTSLNKGRYYAAIQFSSATATYNRTGNVRQVAGWTHLYDRVGGFGALTDPCPTQTESVSAMPGINIRVEV